MSLLTYVHGQIRLGSSSRPGTRRTRTRSAASTPPCSRALWTRADSALSRVVAAGVFDIDSLLDDQDSDAEFDFGLVLFLDGVSGYLAAHDPWSTVSAPTP